jgi:hypothetical protein
LDLDERLIVVRACRHAELSPLFVCEYEDDGHRGGGATVVVVKKCRTEDDVRS